MLMKRRMERDTTCFIDRCACEENWPQATQAKPELAELIMPLLLGQSPMLVRLEKDLPVMVPCVCYTVALSKQRNTYRMWSCLERSHQPRLWGHADRPTRIHGLHVHRIPWPSFCWWAHEAIKMRLEV